MLSGSSWLQSECPLLLQAFGAVGTFETALFRASGKQRLLSEQNMMDCAWDTGNTACMGGYQVSPLHFNRQLPSSQDMQGLPLLVQHCCLCRLSTPAGTIGLHSGQVCPGVSSCSCCTGPVRAVTSSNSAWGSAAACPPPVRATCPCLLQNLGFDWAFKHGILDTEEQYPYQGVSNYCRNISDKAIHLKVCMVPALLALEGTSRAVVAACHLRISLHLMTQ